MSLATDLSNLDRMLTGQETPFIDASIRVEAKHTLIAQICSIVPNHCDVEKNRTKYHWDLLHCKQSVRNKGKYKLCYFPKYAQTQTVHKHA